MGDSTVFSVLPELSISVEDGRRVTRPVEGTVGPSADPADDREARVRLCTDHEQRAENLMIIDLLRQDRELRQRHHRFCMSLIRRRVDPRRRDE